MNTQAILLAFSLILSAQVGTAAPPALPATLLRGQAPDGAVSVVKARASAQPGQPITVRGRIGGRAVALAPQAAIAVLADEAAIQPCNANPEDTCKTPWDYCCEDPDLLKKAVATIQVRGADGKVVRAPLRGLGDLKELSTVVVEGTVDPMSNKDMLVINATGIRVEKP